MRRYGAIIFDLDGTLVHSAPDLHAAANVALTALGRASLDLETVTSFVGNGVGKLIERCLQATGPCSPDIQVTALAIFMDSYNANITTLTRPYPGVVACLTRLHESDIAMGICTNKPSGAADAVCDGLDLTRYFDAIVGAEDGQPKKPDPAPLMNTIAQLEMQGKKILYVGDSTVDHATALNAGVDFRLFSGGYLNAAVPDLRTAQVFDHWSEFCSS